MQAYMKSEMPYLGVKMPALRRVVREMYSREPDLDEVLELWERATHREERYAAQMVLARRKELDTLPVLERMIVEGAWWDYVDTAAAQFRELLRRYPERLKPVVRAWARDENMWKRRVAIIAQLGFKGDTDLDLLYDAIEQNIADGEFFIRKAIGWALRDYAWCDPREVERYVRENEGRLSALSRREALKNVSGRDTPGV